MKKDIEKSDVATQVDELIEQHTLTKTKQPNKDVGTQIDQFRDVEIQSDELIEYHSGQNYTA